MIRTVYTAPFVGPGQQVGHYKVAVLDCSFFYSLLLLPPCTFISFLQAIAEVKSFMPTLCEPLVFFFFVWFVPLNVFPFLTLFFPPFFFCLFFVLTIPDFVAACHHTEKK